MRFAHRLVWLGEMVQVAAGRDAPGRCVSQFTFVAQWHRYGNLPPPRVLLDLPVFQLSIPVEVHLTDCAEKTQDGLHALEVRCGGQVRAEVKIRDI
jgi:hypothetical protein